MHSNLKTIKAIPLKLLDNYKIPTLLEIRGEVFINHKDFNEMNRLRENNDEPLFANPRNFGLHLDHLKQSVARHLISGPGKILYRTCIPRRTIEKIFV